jgi:CHAT domain-containing protein
MIHLIARTLEELKEKRLAGGMGAERRRLAEPLLSAAQALPTRSIGAALKLELADAWLDEAPCKAASLAREVQRSIDEKVAPNLFALSLVVQADALIANRDLEAAFTLFERAAVLARQQRARMHDPILRATSMRERIRIFDGLVAAAFATGRQRQALEFAELARPSLELDPGPASIDEVQAALAADEVVLTYTWLGTARLMVGVIESGHYEVVETSISSEASAALGEVANFFRNAGEKGWSLSRSQATGLELMTSSLLPDSVNAALQRRRSVFVVAHRELHAIPMGLLPIDGKRLGLRQPIAMIPNLRSMTRYVGPAPSRDAVIAGIAHYPLGGSATPQFSAVASRIVERHRAIGYAATRLEEPGALATLADLAKSGRLEGCGLIMLACHGTSVQGNEPGRSFVLMGAERLDAAAIERMRLRADLVMLAACCSGQRAIGGMDLQFWPGDDLFGLQAALWRAGARQTIGALWNADVDAAACMAETVHTSWLAGMSAAEAVHQGALRLAQRPLHLANYDWAVFAATVFGRA